MHALLIVALLMSSSPKEEYEARYLHFGDFVVITEQGPVGVMGTQPIQGKKLLTTPEFYRTIGETDLAGRIETRGRLRSIMAITGGVLLLGGLTTLLVAAGARHAWAAASGGLGALVGLGLLTGAFFFPMPYEPPEVVRGKANEYNQKLRRELGIEENEPLPGIKPPVTASLLPVVGPAFNGLVLTLPF